MMNYYKLMYSLTVIIPFYNEEDFLEKSFTRLYNTKVATQIYLVNDGSTDSSKEIAQNLAKQYSNVYYFSNSKNKGKGSALALVQKKIKTTHVVIHDADLEYNPKDLIGLKSLSSKNFNSLILGSRFLGDMKRTNLYKRTFFANKFLSLLFSIVYFYKITDIATCYKMFPVEFFNKVSFKEKGFSIEIEILSKYLLFNNSILEFPVNYSGRSYNQGKKINQKDGFMYIFNIFKYRILNIFKKQL